MNKNIGLYFSKKSRTLYLMTPSGQFFITKDGHTGKTVGYQTSSPVAYSDADSFMENASLVCELTPAASRKILKVLKVINEV
jgi:hypothetical protein